MIEVSKRRDLIWGRVVELRRQFTSVRVDQEFG